jgi:uncharacterized protein (TIGR03000 family)
MFRLRFLILPVLAASLLTAAPAEAQRRGPAVAIRGAAPVRVAPRPAAVYRAPVHVHVTPRAAAVSPRGVYYHHAGYYYPRGYYYHRGYYYTPGYYARNRWVYYVPAYYPSIVAYNYAPVYSYSYTPPLTVYPYTPSATAYVTPAPAAPAVTQAPMPLPENAARIRVLAPADAAVWLDGEPMPSSGTERLFVSPPLTPGQTYTYEVRARWTADGRAVEQARRAAVRANDTTTVDFTVPAP